MILKGITLASLLLLNPQWTIGSRGFNPPSGGGGGEPTFTEVQSKLGTYSSSGTTFSVTFATAPTAGNAVVCAVYDYPVTDTLLTIADNASTPNSYAISPHSPAAANASPGNVYLVYLLNVPSGAGATITVTASASDSAAIDCTEFHRASGTWVLDTDIASTTTAAATTVTTPTISSSVAGELLYSATVPGTSYVFSVNSPWIQNPQGQDSNIGGYEGWILSGASGGTALNMTLSGSQTYNAMGLALK